MNKQLRRFIFGLLALGVLLLGQGLYTAHLQAQQATRLALGQAGYFMDRLAASASLSLSHDTVQTWIQVKQDWPSLRYLGVLDPQGRAWAAIRPAGSAFGQPFLQRFPVTNQAQQVTLYQGLHSSVSPSWAGLPQVNIVDRPVIVDGTPVVLRAVIDLEPVRLDWQQHMRDVLWFLGSCLLLVSALFWWVHNTPRRLLREAGQFARELSSGHANSLQQEDTGYDEIVDLGRSLQRLQTTLKEQRSSILANERKYKNAIDELDAVVFQIDNDLTWNFLSAGWKRLTGLDPDRFLGQDFSAAFIDSDRPRLLRATQGLVNAERNEYRDEVLLRQIDGSPHEMEIAMHAFTDECGNVLGITGTLSDYSRRQGHETEIARQRRLFQQIIDHLPVSIYVKNEQSDYVLVNEQGARVLGHTPDNMVGKTDRDFLLPDHAAARYAEDREVLRNGVTIAREQMISLNGEVRYWLGRKVRLNAGNGNMLVLQAVIDITDRKKAEIELQRQREFIERVIETDPTLIF
ncbi:MAG: PAS domain-containing protein, partial [Burkholderiales bacterium]